MVCRCFSFNKPVDGYECHVCRGAFAQRQTTVGTLSGSLCGRGDRLHSVADTAEKISGLQYHFTYGNPSADDGWGVWGKRPRAVFTHAFDHLADFVCDGWGAEQYWGVAWKQYIGNPVVRDGSGTFVLYLSDPTACHPADLSGGTVGRDRTCHGRCLLRYRKSAERSTDGKAGLYFATGSVSAICC